jgi:hypothetical protein
MIDHAIQATKSFLAPAIFEPLQSKWSANAEGLRHFLEVVRERQDSKVLRRLFILRELLKGEFAASSLPEPRSGRSGRKPSGDGCSRSG